MRPVVDVECERLSFGDAHGVVRGPRGDACRFERRQGERQAQPDLTVRAAATAVGKYPQAVPTAGDPLLAAVFVGADVRRFAEVSVREAGDLYSRVDERRAGLRAEVIVFGVFEHGIVALVVIACPAGEDKTVVFLPARDDPLRPVVGTEGIGVLCVQTRPLHHVRNVRLGPCPQQDVGAAVVERQVVAQGVPVPPEKNRLPPTVPDYVVVNLHVARLIITADSDGDVRRVNAVHPVVAEFSAGGRGVERVDQ